MNQANFRPCLLFQGHLQDGFVSRKNCCNYLPNHLHQYRSIDLDLLGKHHLFELLGRHPQAIILASQLHKDELKMSLKDLYILLLESKEKYIQEQQLLHQDSKKSIIEDED